MYPSLYIVLLASVCYAYKFANIGNFANIANIARYFSSENIDRKLSINEYMVRSKGLQAAGDDRLTVPELIAKYGFNSEVHYVTTEDGYIIQLHRIAGSPQSPPKQGKKVCFFMHALMLSSAAFVISGPSHALAFRLADEGYDVWLGNNRGNVYAANHTTYKPFGTRSNREQFWKYTLQEIGVYDVANSIDYVLNHTGQTKLNYFGHSQGTAAFFIMASEKPEMNQKIQTMYALAPAAFLKNVKSPPMRFAAPLAKSLTSWLKMAGSYYVYPTSIPICRDIALAEPLCEAGMDLFVGKSDQTNSTLIPIFFGHAPNAASFDQLSHFAQLVNTGRFQKFDYGKVENMIRYKRPTPSDYNLKNVVAPVAVYYGKTDSLAVVEDVRHLIRELPNVVKDYLVPHEKFNHLDYIWGVDTPRLVFDDIIKTIKSRDPIENQDL